jgi:hypothetical protein
MPERLIQALNTLASMQYPSVADILRKRGFLYEADRVDDLISAWTDYQQTTAVPTDISSKTE